MQELEDIINFSASTIKKTLQTGGFHLRIRGRENQYCPVGIALDVKEGFFPQQWQQTAPPGSITIRSSIFEKHDEKYLGIKTSYVDMWQRKHCRHLRTYQV